MKGSEVWPNYVIWPNNQFCFSGMVVVIEQRFVYFVLTDALERLKDMHLSQSVTERASYYKHNQKAKTGGKSGEKYKYVSIILDGMDQAKTRIPHWDRPPKFMDDKQKIDYHLMGTLVEGHGVSGCFIDWSVKQQFSDDSNALLTSLERTIRRVQASRTASGSPQPEVLYIQLDNVGSNKNHWILAYVFWLVHQKIFEKVKISFLLVGHTHENIDQFFSRLSCALRCQRAMTLPQLIEVAANCWTKNPVSHIETEMIDFKSWLDTMEPEPVYNIKKQQVFTVKRNSEGKVVMRAKRYSNSAFYGEDIELLKNIPNEVSPRPVMTQTCLA